MNKSPRPSREIDGKGRTVRDLLADRKYSIDYYQRDARQVLCQKLAEQIWNPERLVQAAAS